VKSESEDKFARVQISIPRSILKSVDRNRGPFARSTWFQLAALEKIQKERSGLLQGLQEATNQRSQATNSTTVDGDGLQHNDSK
jgi:hypothetical protein